MRVSIKKIRITSVFNAYANDGIVADFKFGSCGRADVVEHGERVVTERKGIVARRKGFGAIGVNS